MNHPGDDLSLAQLVGALGRKLDDSKFEKEYERTLGMPYRAREVYMYELEDIIRSASASISRLRQIRNTNSPINRLPIELLNKIFHILQEDVIDIQTTFPLQLQYSDAHTTLTWLFTLTWVCRHWRNAALSNPSLWQYYHSGHETPLWSVMECFLNRSSPLPLHIHYRVPTPDSNSEADEYWDLDLNDLERQPTPDNLDQQLLRGFLVDNPDRIGGLHIVGSLATHFLHEAAFPNLSSLHLDHFDEGSILPELLPSLTHLSLRNPSPAHPLTTHLFARFFVNFPCYKVSVSSKQSSGTERPSSNILLCYTSVFPHLTFRNFSGLVGNFSGVVRPRQVHKYQVNNATSSQVVQEGDWVFEAVHRAKPRIKVFEVLVLDT